MWTWITLPLCHSNIGSVFYSVFLGYPLTDSDSQSLEVMEPLQQHQSLREPIMWLEQLAKRGGMSMDLEVQAEKVADQFSESDPAEKRGHPSMTDQQLYMCVFCTTNAHICDPLQACYPRRHHRLGQ